MYPRDVIDVLKLTGQRHNYDQRPYIMIMSVWVDSVGVVAAIGINGKRVVDIAVHPDFRLIGLAKRLVIASRCTKAYVVMGGPRGFWEALGWTRTEGIVDKGTLVNVYERV